MLGEKAEADSMRGIACGGGAFAGVARVRRRLFLGEDGLAGRPGEAASAEQVKVEVVDGLPAVVAGVDDDAIAAGVELELAGDLGGGGEEMAEQVGVLGSGLDERVDVAPRDEENVCGRLRLDVGEGEAKLVGVDRLGGDFALKDAAEETVHGCFSVAGGSHFCAGGK